jgi:hypothetical protein
VEAVRGRLNEVGKPASPQDHGVREHREQQAQTENEALLGRKGGTTR